MVREVNPTEFVRHWADRPGTLLLDVREPTELEIASPAGIVKIPMGDVAARVLETAGYPSVANLTGGNLAWSREVDPSLATYRGQSTAKRLRAPS